MQQPALQRFTDKVILITASATGIGLGIAKRIASEGGTVLINSRNDERVNAAVEQVKKLGGKAVACVGDITLAQDRAKIKNFISDKYGKLDCLVVNHAVGFGTIGVLNTNEEAWDQMYNTNLKSYFFFVKEMYDLIKKCKGNIILNTSHVAYHMDKFLGVYSMLKAALVAMNKIFSKEFQRDGIRVNSIAPGVIKTEMIDNIVNDERQVAKIKRQYGMSRLGLPEDIAGCVAFLASDDASYITGENIVIMGTAASRL